MSNKATSTGANSAQIRGDIQAGLTGDKQPGFDPAMAPLETDAEAGGATLQSPEVENELQGQRSGRKPQVSADYGSAMRPVFSGNRPHYPLFWPIVIFCLLGISLIALLIAYGLKS